MCTRIQRTLLRSRPAGSALFELVERPDVAHHRPRRSDLGGQCGQCVVDGRVRRWVEVAVTIAEGMGVAVEDRRRVLVGEPAPEPGALDLGEVADEAEHRQVARRARGAAGLLVAEPLGLAQEHGALEVEERLQRRALLGDRRVGGDRGVRFRHGQAFGVMRYFSPVACLA